MTGGIGLQVSVVVANFCNLQIDYSLMRFVISQNYKMQGCQWYGVKRIKSYFLEKRELSKKVWDNSLLLQVVVSYYLK